jgi:hypothetical protein
MRRLAAFSELPLIFEVDVPATVVTEIGTEPDPYSVKPPPLPARIDPRKPGLPSPRTDRCCR